MDAVGASRSGMGTQRVAERHDGMMRYWGGRIVSLWVGPPQRGSRVV